MKLEANCTHRKNKEELTIETETEYGVKLNINLTELL